MSVDLADRAGLSRSEREDLSASLVELGLDDDALLARLGEADLQFDDETSDADNGRRFKSGPFQSLADLVDHVSSSGRDGVSETLVTLGLGGPEILARLGEASVESGDERGGAGNRVGGTAHPMEGASLLMVELWALAREDAGAAVEFDDESSGADDWRISGGAA